MSINLASASDGRVDFGDLASVAGQTELSFAIILTPTAAVADDRRLFSQWGGSAGLQAFICTTIDTDELQFVVSDGAGTYYGEKTSTLNLTNGTTYRIVVTIAFGSPPVAHIYVNGVDMALTNLGSGNVTASINSATNVEVGHETQESADGVDGDYAEFAIWQRVLTDAQAMAFTASQNPPTCCGPIGVIYLPMATTTDLTDQWSAVTASLTDGSNATHPTMVPCGASFNVVRL